METKKLKVLEGALITLYNLQMEIKKTIKSIESEKNKIESVNYTNNLIPEAILKMVENGELVQWVKNPIYFFVPKVKKARLVWDTKNQILCSRFRDEIPTAEQRLLFTQAILKIIREVKINPPIDVRI